MSEVQPIVDPIVPPTPADPNLKPTPKRSPLERALVWGGILVLLVVVGSELLAQRGYNSTLAGLEETFDSGQTLAETELPGHIRGFAIRNEEKKNEVRTLTMTWPSLFRTYKLRLPIATGDILCVVETESGYKDQMKEVPTAPIASPTPAVATGN
ncbi:MAG: hypothetical protein JWP89_3987 [Schlesneria sp.]|nr:hypothetical protein [Schlesneria sp.]